MIELNKMMILKYLKIKILLIAFMVLGAGHSIAQYSPGQAIDKIIAKVDNYIILKSDLEKAYLDYTSRGNEGGDQVRCGILESLVVNKLLVAKAEIDSVEVTDSEVQNNLDQRMQVIISQIGSEQKLEDYYGKTVEQFKEELFTDIKQQLMADKMQKQITEDIRITPTEVRKFFGRIPEDSIPFLSTEVSIGQIVRIPKVGKNQKEKARQKLLDIRNRILNGKDRTDEYGGWIISILKNNNLELTDKDGNKFTGNWNYNASERLLKIDLNEISFSANEFQFTWRLTKFGNDSLKFDNYDFDKTSKFFARKVHPSNKITPVITADYLQGEWRIISFNASGEDFAAMAKEYSDDPGSARMGGDLGYASRGTMVPEFEAAAMRMKPGEISMPVETDFGFHLIQLLDRRGNEFHARHILIRPDYSKLDFEETDSFLDSLRSLILNDSLTFEKAAKDYSDDPVTSGNGGFLIDANGSSKVSVEDLDPVIFFTIDTMDVGEISTPLRYRMTDGKEAVRILYYKDKVKPHQANLKDDYQKIQLAALNEKKQNALDEWFAEAKKEVFIQIDDSYKNCSILEQ